jgi:hypothetical protein
MGFESVRRGRPNVTENTAAKASGVEQLKQTMRTPLRWGVLGAGLLSAGCGEVFETRKPHTPEQTEALQQFDFGNSFPVDEATLSTETQEQIAQQMDVFLDGYNSREKFVDLAHSRIVIAVSSDERPTKSWGEHGNQALSEARLKELDHVVRQLITEYDFADAIPADEIDEFKQKTFTRRMPAGEWGVGFTPINRLLNPQTGAYYTEAEIKKLPRSKRDELYDAARYARVTVELPGKNEIDTQYDRLVEIMAGYNHVTLLVDRSGSMHDDYQRLGHSFSAAYDRVQGDFISDTTYIVPFERGADVERYANIPPAEVEGYFTALRLYGGEERLFNSLGQVLQKDSQTPDHVTRRAIVALSDEGIQDFSITKLREMSQVADTNQTDIYFALVGAEGIITFVDNDGLQYEYDQFARGFDYQYTHARVLGSERQTEWLEQSTKAVRVNRYGTLDFLVLGRGY